MNRHDNRGLGSKFGKFIKNCHIPDGGSFLVIPLPPVLGVPTQDKICNFP
jgi:hypothetical protein